MKIIVDGFDDLITLENEKTLGDLLPPIEAWLKENGRVPLKYQVDQIPVIDPNQSVGSRSVDEIQTLIITTGETPYYPYDLTEEIYHTLKQLSDTLTQTVTVLRSSQPTPGYALFAQTLTFIEWIAVSSLTVLKNGVPLSLEPVQELNPFIVQLKDAFKQRDAIRMSDLLEYEIKPLMARFQKHLEELANKGRECQN